MRKIEEFPEGGGPSKITIEHEDWEVSVITEDGKTRLEFYSRYAGRAKVDTDLLIDYVLTLIYAAQERRRGEAEEARQKALAPVPEALRRACIVGPGTPFVPAPAEKAMDTKDPDLF